MESLKQAVQKITGNSPNTLLEIKAELINFIKLNDADDLLIDKDDFEMMIEIASIYSEVDSSEIMTHDLDLYFQNKKDTEGHGHQFPSKRSKQQNALLKKFAENVLAFHPDMTYVLDSKGVSFFGTDKKIFSLRKVRRVKTAQNSVVGELLFTCITKETEKLTLIPMKYLDLKVWGWEKQRKQNKLTGKFFRLSEVLDILSDRKIIAHGKY